MLRAQLHFLKRAKSPKVDVYGTALVGPKVGARTLLFSVNLPDQSEDQYSWLDLGCIMVPCPGWEPRHSVWGQDVGPVDLESGIYGITDEQNYLVEVAVERHSFVFELRRKGHDMDFITYSDALRIVDAA